MAGLNGNGGYFIWNLYPQYQVFIDGRTPNVYDHDYYWYYQRLGNEQIRAQLTAQYGFNIVFFPIANSLTADLSVSDDWSLIFFDNISAVFVDNNSEDNEDIIEQYAYSVLNPTSSIDSYLEKCDDTEYMAQLKDEIKRNTQELKLPIYTSQILAQLAIKCNSSTTSDLQEAEKLLQSMVATRPPSASPYHSLASIELELEKETSAIAHYKKALEISPSTISRAGLGIAYHNAGDYKRAKKIFSKIAISSLRSIPPEYYQIYGRVSYQLDDNERAVELFHRYLSLIEPEKITAQDYLDLSLAYKDAVQTELAAEYLAKSQAFEQPDQKIK